MRRVISFAIFMAVIAPTQTGWAHHSTARYDLSRNEVIDGVVQSFQWANPHSYIQLIVTDADGNKTQWAIEAGTPATETRMGWTRESVKPGDKVSMVVAPARDSSHGATLKTVTLPNGTVLRNVAASAQASTIITSLPSLQRATPR